MPGFSTVMQDNIELSVNQTIVLDFKLALAGVTAAVTVEGDRPTDFDDGRCHRQDVKTAKSTPSRASPATTRTSSASPRACAARRRRTRASRGNAYYANSWKIDGVENDQESVAGVQSRVTQDAVAEVQVLTNQFSAEFGRALGGAVNVITRSGTNHFHGRAFYYGQDGTWNSKNFFALTSPKPTTRPICSGHPRRPDRPDHTHYFPLSSGSSRQPDHPARSQRRALHQPVLAVPRLGSLRQSHPPAEPEAHPPDLVPPGQEHDRERERGRHRPDRQRLLPSQPQRHLIASDMGVLSAVARQRAPRAVAEERPRWPCPIPSRGPNRATELADRPQQRRTFRAARGQDPDRGHDHEDHGDHA